MARSDTPGTVSQRRQVMGIVALASLPLIALVLTGIWQGKALVERRTAEERIALAQAAAVTTAAFVEGSLSTARALAVLPVVRAADPPPETRGLMEQVQARNPDWEGWGLAGPDGWNLATSGAEPRTLYVGDRPYFRETLLTGRTVVSPVVLNRRTGRPTVVLAAPVDFTDGTRGAIIISLSLDRLASEIQSLGHDPSIRIGLVDGEGNPVIAHEGQPLDGPPTARGTPAVNAALAGEVGSAIVDDRAGTETLVAYAPVPSLGWSILVSQPAADAFEVGRRQTALGVVTLVLAVAVAGAIGWYLGGRLAELYRRQHAATLRAEATARTLEAVSAESERRRRFLEGVIAAAPVAIAILRGREYRHEAVNARYQALKPDSPMLGRTLAEVFPRTAEQGALALFDRVYATGEQVVLVDHPWQLLDDRGREMTRYFTHVVARIDDETGEPNVLLSMVLETTDTVRARQRAEREKDELLSTVSHELKTPLTSLGLAAQLAERMLVRGPLDEARLTRHVGTIRAQVTRASQLIGELLDVSRIETGRLTMTWEPVDLVPLVHAAAERHQDLLPEEGTHRIEFQTDRPAVVVQGDEARIEQIVANLLSNAVKYSPGGGSVEVRVAAEDGRAVLTVADHGIGVPPDERDRLFAPFRRTTRALNTGVEGTGLGLYITRRIVEAHAGGIEVADTPGGGTTFRVSLPVERPTSAGSGPDGAAGPPDAA